MRPNGRSIAVALAAIVMSACSGPPPEARAAMSAQPGQAAVPLSREAVSGATIAGVFDQPVTLSEGRYEGPPLAAGAAARPRLLLLEHLVRIDVIDEAVPRAVALLAESSGGSGERIYLAVIGMVGGRATSLATTLVGDRTRIRTVRVVDRKVVLEVIETGPNEPACCPTQLARHAYVYRDGALIREQSEVTGTLSIAILAGPAWSVIEVDGEPLQASATPPTLQVEGSRLTGFSGCNRFTGSVSEPSPGTLAMGPVAGTRMACAPPAGDIEQRVLRTLGAVTRYSFVAGRVSLSGMDGGVMRSLLLTREVDGR